MGQGRKINYLQGVAQHYAWGGNSFIPSLIPSTKSEGKPVAEYWLGAHPMAPSIVINDEHLALDKLVSENPEQVLGKKVAEKFGQFPYLLKLLDVKEMLSIQVHPSKAAAEKEFARENAEGIPIDSVKRNYKDDNHKPELMVAMSDFWLLHGFKPQEKLVNILQVVPEFKLLQIFFDRFS
ncbi:MAG TPA: mannose-6-phosphate isomerase, class I, partial [Chitinophagaceae bacterium]|nr:mannose-6-phosphate isomerase, class I [Chitinophagaceae bacterium]